MDKYVTGAVIRKLREDKKMTQEELAGKLYGAFNVVMLLGAIYSIFFEVVSFFAFGFGG